MKKTLLLTLIFSLIMTGCGARFSSPSQPVDLSTSIQITLEMTATLYRGPGNINYEVLTDLPSGTALNLTGIFGDFVQAEIASEGIEMTGYIWKESISDLPDGLPLLDDMDVPWEPMYLPQCAPGEYDPQTDSVTFSTREGEGFFATDSAAWLLTTPVRIQIKEFKSAGDKTGEIKVLGRPVADVDPTVWWVGVTAMSIQSLNGNYLLAISDGTSEKSVTIELNRSISLPIQIIFDQPEGKGFSILDENNQELQHIDLTTWIGLKLPDGLFPKRKFYFGTNSYANSPMVITGLNIGTIPDGKWVKSQELNSGLAGLGEEIGVKIGTIFDVTKMIDRRYCQVMQNEFNLIEITEFNATSYPFWLGPGQYDFNTIDRIVEFADRQGWKMFASHLVWGDYNTIPDWLRNGNYDRDEYIDILEQHIKTLVGRYKGRIQEWSVANEAPERIYSTKLDKNTTLRDFWYDKIGKEYIEMAFRWTREADPDGILVFNSSIAPPMDPFTQAVFELMHDIVKDFTARDVPLDVVGLQMHLLGPGANQIPPMKDQIVDTMKSFTDLGVKVYYTELEVDVGSRLESQAENYDYQAQVYREVMDACIALKACEGIYFWGFADSLSYVICSRPNPICLNEPNGDPLLFDRDFKPKVAYKAVRDTLAGIPANTRLEITPAPTGVDVPGGAPAPGIPALENVYDDFNDVDSGDGYNRSKWRLTGASTSPQVYLQDGSMILGDASDATTGDVTLIARDFDSIILHEPVFFEAAVSLPATSAPGSAGIKIVASNPSIGTWFSGCSIERYSSQFSGKCMDFVWSSKMSGSYETEKQSFQPGSWHIFRIEIAPVTMTIDYWIDGIQLGSHTIQNAAWRTIDRYQFSLSTWKTTINNPLLGVFDYVSIGQLVE